MCVCVCIYVHVSVHNAMCSAGPEVAAGTALEQIQYIGKGGGGGGGGGWLWQDSR